LPIRSLGSNLKLLLTANASHPRLQFTEKAKGNPLQAPMFCMVLRKHLSGGKLLDVVQPGFERIVELHIESMNEMGDLSIKRLIIEIMGKHSNIMLVDEQGIVLDSIKHISHDKSSVREVLPGRPYVYPPSGGRVDPLRQEDFNGFCQAVLQPPQQALGKAIYLNHNGISPIAAQEICFRAGLDPADTAGMLEREALTRLFEAFRGVMRQVSVGGYVYQVFLKEDGKPFEFSCMPMTMWDGVAREVFDSPSSLLSYYYDKRDTLYRVNQKTADLRKIIQINIDRCLKKKEMYHETLESVSDRETQRLYGELLTAHMYAVEKGMTSVMVQNFYDAAEPPPFVTIPLDPQKTPSENAQFYFARYNKAKRTLAALQGQMRQNEEELAYLDSVMNALINADNNEGDIAEIREELAEQGFVKRRSLKKGEKPQKSKPMQFVSSDGFEIYVGKNNRQNDELTLKMAENGDIWFHTKGVPGSHVIVKTQGQAPPETTLAEAARIAAYFSKARESGNVAVDYCPRKNVKKPNGAKPGMVIYDTYKTAWVAPGEDLVAALQQKPQ